MLSINWQWISVHFSVMHLWVLKKKKTNKNISVRNFQFEMWAFLLQFLYKYPTIYLIICCLIMLIWVYMLHVELFKLNAHQKRLEIHTKREKTKKNRKTPNATNISENIRCIKGNVQFHFPLLHFSRRTFNANTIFLFFFHYMWYVCVCLQLRSNATDFSQILKQILRKSCIQTFR